MQQRSAYAKLCYDPHCFKHAPQRCINLVLQSSDLANSMTYTRKQHLPIAFSRPHHGLYHRAVHLRNPAEHKGAVGVAHEGGLLPAMLGQNSRCSIRHGICGAPGRVQANADMPRLQQHHWSGWEGMCELHDEVEVRRLFIQQNHSSYCECRSCAGVIESPPMQVDETKQNPASWPKQVYQYATYQAKSDAMDEENGAAVGCVPATQFWARHRQLPHLHATSSSASCGDLGEHGSIWSAAIQNQELLPFVRYCHGGCAH